MDKRTLFSICLQYAGKTSSHFASRHDVTTRFVNYVVAGERRHAELEADIDEFIASILPYLELDIEDAQKSYSAAA